MIISHRHRFIFIKTQKTAGSSIEVFLYPHCGPDDILTPVIPAVPPHQARNYRVAEVPEGPEGLSAGNLQGVQFRDVYRNHSTALDVREKVGESIWRDYFVFCVERNPWDKTLSHYHMQRHQPEGPQDLNAYFQKGQFCLNHPLYTDGNGQVMVDQIIDYDRLNEGLGEVFDRLGIPFDGDLGLRIKSEYRQGHRQHYREVYSAEQRQRIADAYAPEIDLFGYAW